MKVSAAGWNVLVTHSWKRRILYLCSVCIKCTECIVVGSWLRGFTLHLVDMWRISDVRYNAINRTHKFIVFNRATVYICTYSMRPIIGHAVKTFKSFKYFVIDTFCRNECFSTCKYVFLYKLGMLYCITITFSQVIKSCNYKLFLLCFWG